jgi:putative FmdB family regulatory protein
MRMSGRQDHQEQRHHGKRHIAPERAAAKLQSFTRQFLGGPDDRRDRHPRSPVAHHLDIAVDTVSPDQDQGKHQRSGKGLTHGRTLSCRLDLSLMDDVGTPGYLGLYVFPSVASSKGRQSDPMSEWRAHMPLYEYRCRDCHSVFDRTEPLAEHGRSRPQCPKCKSKHVEQVFTSFFAKTSHKS